MEEKRRLKRRPEQANLTLEKKAEVVNKLRLKRNSGLEKDKEVIQVTNNGMQCDFDKDNKNRHMMADWGD
jgi:hypothetical protein